MTHKDYYRAKTAFVSGAAAGIGRALSLDLMSQGAFVYGADLDASGLEALRLCSPLTFAALKMDVSDPLALAEALDKIIAEKGRLDFVFNNAGIALGGATEQMTLALWKKICDVNLWSAVYGSQLAYQRMLAQGGGCIVNTASLAGLVPVPNSCAYTTTKHGVVGLSLALAQEAKARGVRVCVVVPGLVDTGIFKKALNLPGYDYARSVQASPVHKISPEKIARLFLKHIARGKTLIVEPLSARLIWYFYRLAPLTVSRLIAQKM